jgi:hypothetical protein
LTYEEAQHVDDTDNIRTSAGEDAATESAVLQQVLVLHPTQITLAELTREVGGHPSDFVQRDAIERAVRNLTGAGLLHLHDSFVLPTRAALRFDELLKG